MRFFTDEAYRGDHEEWDTALRAYESHLQEIDGVLPPDLRRLAIDPRLSLHDARIRSLVMDRDAGTVAMDVEIAPDFSVDNRGANVNLLFSGASFEPDDLQMVAYAVGAEYSTAHWGTTRTVIRAAEVDVAANDQFLVRLRLWPFYEFALHFADMSLSERPGEPDDGQVGSFTFF